MKDIIELLNKEEEIERQEKAKKQVRRVSPIIAQLYPRESGGVFENRMLMCAFDPSRFSVFSGILPQCQVLALGIRVHYISVEDEESGEIYTKMVLCPRETQQKFSKLFELKGKLSEDCMICEVADKWWEKYNLRREETGIRGLPLEEYREAVLKDDFLVKFRAEARKFSPVSRYIFVVFDLDKYEGRKPLQEGEFCEYQILFAPETIFLQITSHARTFVKNGINFWSIDSPHVVSIVKDTREGILQTKYAVSVEPRAYPLQKDLRDYLADVRNIPDPSSLILLWTEPGVKETVEREYSRVVGRQEVNGTQQTVSPSSFAAQGKKVTAQEVEAESGFYDKERVDRLPPRRLDMETSQNVAVGSTGKSIVEEEKKAEKEEKKEEEKRFGTPLRRRIRFGE